jgi:hypothetical protein
MGGLKQPQQNLCNTYVCCRISVKKRGHARVSPTQRSRRCRKTVLRSLRNSQERSAQVARDDL